MKKFLFFAAVAAVSLSSCQKIDKNDSLGTDDEKSVVTVSLTSPTKATVEDTADEAKVSSIQIFVFKGDAIDGYKNATADEVTALSAQVEATVGTRDIFVFVNAPSLASYTNKTALLAAVSSLSDNASDKFVMSGKLTSQSLTPNFSTTVNVDRYAARVRISKITRNFSNTALQGVTFKITKIYLTSVVTNVKYDYSAPTTYSWLNASFGSTRSLSTDNAFVYNKLATATEVAQAGSYTTVHSLYGYPNTYDADDTNTPATYKKTRLVVETQIDVDGSGTLDDDEYFTYPIPLGALASNKSYEIKELIITKLGNASDGDDDADDGEDDDIISTTATFTIVVNDWTEVLIGTSGTFTI